MIDSKYLHSIINTTVAKFTNTNMMSMDLGKLQNFCSFLSDAIYKRGRAFDWLICKKI